MVDLTVCVRTFRPTSIGLCVSESLVSACKLVLR